MNRRAKIVATLGPSSATYEIITELVSAGLDVARLNFSHGTHASHLDLIKNIRKVSEDLGKPIVILQDLQGPKLRVGKLPNEGIELIANEMIRIEIDSDGSKKDFVNYNQKTINLEIPNVLSYLKKDGSILLDDGKLELKILDIDKSGINACVILGGRLFSSKGVNLPGANLDVPGFTEKDKEDLIFGLENGVNAVALSFVKTADDILRVKDFIKSNQKKDLFVPIIAKLELPQAIQNLASILDASDGVMVARGDLGVETSPSEVPVIQKEIIKAANRKAKVVITATQMLDSMISNPRPTRAEASDVANAIWDGTDAVMLSGETASGAFPIISVLMMDAIIKKAERTMGAWGHHFSSTIGEEPDDAFAISIAARELAHERQVCSVAVFTQSGRSALLQSKARPDVPIIAFTPKKDTYGILGMYWGVDPYLVPFSDTLEDMIQHVEKTLLSIPEMKRGQKVVMISGFPIGAMRPTNLALLHTIGSITE
jgi:pyruvate kinase